MIQITRFDLVDFASPEGIAGEIIRKITDLPIPVPIAELCKMLDIIGIEEVSIEGFEGGLFTDAEKSEGYILVKVGSLAQRRRFTIAHELGHFLCPSHTPPPDGQFNCSSESMQLTFAPKEDRMASMEVEANRFAASILMPLPHFKKDLRVQKEADIDQIVALARRYDTSREATARRYVDAQDEACAVVISQNNRILRLYRGEDFPYIDLQSGDLVPHGSLSAKNALTEGAISYSDEQNGDVWSLDGKKHRIPMIYEQVLQQSDGYRLTLLKLAEDLEEIEEEEDLQKSWTPRFRR